jgi:hypothetical protein
MTRDPTERFRVLIWVPPGVYRSIIVEAFEGAGDLAVLDAVPPGDGPLGTGASALREAAERLLPDVIIVRTPVTELRRLVGDLGETPAVFVSTDGRRALAYDRDVSADSLLSLVRSVARCEAPR